jgi:DNA mismatch repair protein MutS
VTPTVVVGQHVMSEVGNVPGAPPIRRLGGRSETGSLRPQRFAVIAAASFVARSGRDPFAARAGLRSLGADPSFSVNCRRKTPMMSLSMLCREPDGGATKTALDAPTFFADLNLDQIVDAITAGKAEYDLKPFFYRSLNDIDAIHYRHEIMQDLENAILFESVRCFANAMRTLRDCLAQAGKLHFKYQKQAWFLDAMQVYCDAIQHFRSSLAVADLRSRGFLAFRAYLTTYIDSAAFDAVRSDTQAIKAALSKVRYCVLIKGDTVKVRKYASEIDYSANVEQTFERFKQGAAKDYRVSFSKWPAMNHIEEKVLELVSKLYPDDFSRLGAYCTEYRNCLDDTVVSFDREIQFYVACLEYVATFNRAGLMFCYPTLSASSKDVRDYGAFDLALAQKLIVEKSPIVCNDFRLDGAERAFVVTGPNQGGKTTFARTFGQLHYLASLGCPVPGREARLCIFDRIFTHFEKKENIKNLRGKLQDDLIRVHGMLEQATQNSIVIMNEIFTSTTLHDAIYLSHEIMKWIADRDLLCVWVTFVDELASFGRQTVSLVSTVDPDRPGQRTYKIIRRPPDGLSYAVAIAEKHRVTYDALKERIQ